MAAASLGLRRHWIDALRGAAFLFAAFLAFNVPWDNNIGAAIVFGAAFLVDGLLRIGSAYVVHSPRWRVGTVAGAIEVCLAAMIRATWPPGRDLFRESIQLEGKPHCWVSASGAVHICDDY
ncbi:hypothetical protein [Brucella intermedia]